MALIRTSDVILALRQGVTNLRPVLQIVDIQKMWNAQTAVEQFYIVLSDGVNQQSSLCAAPLNDKFRKNLVTKGSIVQLLEYGFLLIKNERILLVQNIEVLKSEIIGDPRLGPGVQQYQRPARVGPGPRGVQQYHRSARVDPGPAGVQQYQRPARVSAPAVKSAEGLNTVGQASGEITKSCLRPPPPFPPVPIANLHPWIIRARVTSKSGVEYFETGTLFSFCLIDVEGGEIKAKCFNHLIDKWYHQIEVGKVYLLSQFTLKSAMKAYSHLRHDWEIIFQNQTTMELDLEEDPNGSHCDSCDS